MLSCYLSKKFEGKWTAGRFGRLVLLELLKMSADISVKIIDKTIETNPIKSPPMHTENMP